MRASKEAKITVKGKKGKLADINKGANVVLQLEVTNGRILVKSLEVMAE